MSERTVKTVWHLGLATLAIVEWKMSETSFRKMLCGACAGWHLSAAVEDSKS